jgi:hypothetical protein
MITVLIRTKENDGSRTVHGLTPHAAIDAQRSPKDFRLEVGPASKPKPRPAAAPR